VAIYNPGNLVLEQTAISWS